MAQTTTIFMKLAICDSCPTSWLLHTAVSKGPSTRQSGQLSHLYAWSLSNAGYLFALVVNRNSLVMFHFVDKHTFNIVHSNVWSCFQTCDIFVIITCFCILSVVLIRDSVIYNDVEGLSQSKLTLEIQIEIKTTFWKPHPITFKVVLLIARC